MALTENIQKKCSYSREVLHTPSETAQQMFYCMQRAGHFICDQEFHVRRKEYKSFLVKITLGGSGHLIYRNREYDLQKNQLMFINCNEYQEYFTTSEEGWESKWIHFFGDMSLECFDYIYRCVGPLITMPEDNRIGDIIGSIMDLNCRDDHQIEIKVSSLIQQLLTELLLVASTSSDSLSNAEYQRYMRIAREFIENNYQNTIEVEDIAESANLTRSHFSRLFKRYTGFGPHEYLVKYRISIAKSLLNDSSQSIEAIALRTGFNDSNAFIRAFKQYEMVTPLKYRSIFCMENLKAED